MDPNPYTSSESNQVDGSELPKHAVLGNRLLFAVAAFLSALGAFYFSLTVNVLGSPYMHEHISLGYFLNWLDWALPFAIICTSVVAVASFLIERVEHKHFLVLLIPFGIELALTFWFFIAFFGI